MKHEGGKVTKEELWWKIFDCPYKDKCNIPKGIFPAPFFVGDNYERVANKVLFIAHNPGWPQDRDTDYNYTCENIPKFGNRFDLLMQTIASELRVDKIWRRLIGYGIKARLETTMYTNLVKCATKTGSVTPEMLQNCTRWLGEEMRVSKPKHIVCLGKGVYEELPENMKGSFQDRIDWVYHPSGWYGHRNKGPGLQRRIRRINGWLGKK